MTLIVETGAGLPDAESYETVSGFKAYAGKVGYDIGSFDDTKIEQALRRSTIWLDARYGSVFPGIQTKPTTQALLWPRSGAVYRCMPISPTVIPDRLKMALCEAAWRELQTPNSLSPDQNPDRIKRDKVGDVETEFSLSAPGVQARITAIDNLLAGLTKPVASAFVGRAVRA